MNDYLNDLNDLNYYPSGIFSVYTVYDKNKMIVENIFADKMAMDFVKSKCNIFDDITEISCKFSKTEILTIIKFINEISFKKCFIYDDEFIETTLDTYDDDILMYIALCAIFEENLLEHAIDEFIETMGSKHIKEQLLIFFSESEINLENKKNMKNYILSRIFEQILINKTFYI